MASPASIVASNARRANRVSELAQALKVAAAQQSMPGVPSPGLRIPDTDVFIPGPEAAPVVGGVPVPAPRPSIDAQPAPATPSYGVVLDAPAARQLTPEAAEALMRKIEVEGIGSVAPEQLEALRLMSGDLDGPLSGELDSLDASAMPITADEIKAPNLTPNKQRVDPITNLAERIRQVTTDASTEPTAGLRALIAEIDALPDEGKIALMQHPAIAEGIESAAAQTPEGRAAAIGNAKQRLVKLHKLSQQDTTGRAAEQLAAAKEARDIAAAPAAGNPARAASAEDAAAARELVGETLPKGNVAAIMEAFNSLPAERKAEVLGRLPGGAPIESRGSSMSVRLGNADPTAPRTLIGRLLDGSTGEPAFLPNAASQFMPAASPLEQAILELDDAVRSGDPQAIEMARLNVQTTPAAPEETQSAQKWFAQRQAAIDSLHRAIVGTDPMVLEEQARMLANAAPAQPKPVYAPGSRSPVVQPVDVPASEMPSAADVANAVERERQARLDQGAPGGFLSEKDRLEAFPAVVNAEGETRDPKVGDIPAALRGRDGRSTPYESRPIGSRLTDTNDKDAIAQANELEAAIAESDAEVRQALYELRLAQIGRTSGRTASTAEDVAAAQARLADAQRRALAIRNMEETLFPPRRVNERTGRAETISQKDIDEGNVPAGWVVERGRKAWSPSHINKPGNQETVDGLIMTIAGGRPKAQTGLDRSNAALSPSARAVQNEELLDVFGDDAIEFMPDGGAEDLPELGQRGKRGRLGGTAQASRTQAAVQALYTHKTAGLVNPLLLRRANGTTPLFADARAAAEDLMKRSTIFKPDTASYEMALGRLTRAIDDTFGTKSATPSTWVEQADGSLMQVPAARSKAEAAIGSPAGDVREGTSIDVDAIPALAGRRNAIDIPEPRDSTVVIDDEPGLAEFPARGQRPARVAVDDEPVEPEFTGNPDDVAVELKGRRSRAGKKDAAPANKTAEDSKLDASSTDITDVTNDKPIEIESAPTPSKGRRRTKKEVNDAIAQFKQDARDKWRDSGLSKEEIDAEVDAEVNARRKELESEFGETTGGSVEEVSKAAAADAAETPQQKGGKKSRGRKKPPANAADNTEGAKKKNPEAESTTPDGAAPDGTNPPSTDGTQTPPKTPEKKGWFRRALGWAPLTIGGAGAAFVVNNALNSLGRRVDTSGLGDNPPGGSPPGGPVATPISVRSDDPVSVLTGSSGISVADDVAGQEAAIQRALDRIRGSRASSDSPPYQTIQNYNIWR